MGDEDVSSPFLGRGGVPGYVHFTNKQKLIASECQQNPSREFILLSNATCSRTGLLWIRAEIKEHLCTARFWFPPPLSLLHQTGLYFWSHCQLTVTFNYKAFPLLTFPLDESPAYPSWFAALGSGTGGKSSSLQDPCPCCQGVFLSVYSPASAIHTLTDSRLLLLTGGRLDTEQH